MLSATACSNSDAFFGKGYTATGQDGGCEVAFALAVLDLGFGVVLKISVNHDLHLLFAPRVLMHKLVGKFSNSNSVKKFSNFMHYQ